MVQCKKCKQFASLNKDDIVKCKGGCDSVFHKKCLKNLKAFMEKEICTDCQKSPSKILINTTEMAGDKILAEVNEKLSILYKMEEKLERLTETVDFYSAQYQEMVTFKTEAEKKLKSLEQKNIYLEKYNKALEERVEELEVRNKEKNIEIHGMEKLDNENTKEAVKKLALKLDLNPNDIEEAQRVGSEKPNDPKPKPKVISVTLRTKTARNNWIAAKKEHRITNNTVYDNGNERKIFINEDLPKFKRQLLWVVRNQLKPKGFEYIWVQNSHILVRKNAEERKIYNIRCEKDLDKLDNSCSEQ
ncbi:hypothetical protein O0L34_g6718 [Tuta absoluta]|nr:hypothetical protein O0L34_g6718 [Tuta absoluta]